MNTLLYHQLVGKLRTRKICIHVNCLQPTLNEQLPSHLPMEKSRWIMKLRTTSSLIYRAITIERISVSVAWWSERQPLRLISCILLDYPISGSGLAITKRLMSSKTCHLVRETPPASFPHDHWGHRSWYQLPNILDRIEMPSYYWTFSNEFPGNNLII